MTALRVGSGWGNASLGDRSALHVLVEITEDGFAMFATSLGGTFGCRAAEVTIKLTPASPELIQAGIAESEHTIAGLRERADKLSAALELLQGRPR